MKARFLLTFIVFLGATFAVTGLSLAAPACGLLLTDSLERLQVADGSHASLDPVVEELNQDLFVRSLHTRYKIGFTISSGGRGQAAGVLTIRSLGRYDGYDRSRIRGTADELRSQIRSRVLFIVDEFEQRASISSKNARMAFEDAPRFQIVRGSVRFQNELLAELNGDLEAQTLKSKFVIELRDVIEGKFRTRAVVRVSNFEHQATYLEIASYPPSDAVQAFAGKILDAAKQLH